VDKFDLVLLTKEEGKGEGEEKITV